MTKRKEHTWDVRHIKQPISKPHPSIFDGRSREITPEEAERATRVITRHVHPSEAHRILAMLGLA